MRPPTAMLAFVLFVAGPALADTTVPTPDLKGLGDPPGLSRYTGPVLLYRNDADYDELRLPVSRPVD